MNSQELLQNAIALSMQGEDIGKAGKELLEKNPELTNAIRADFEAQIKKQQEQQKKAA